MHSAYITPQTAHTAQKEYYTIEVYTAPT